MKRKDAAVKLYWRAIVWITAIVLLSSLCTSLLSFYPLYQQTQENLEQTYERRSEQNATAIKQYFGRIKDSALQITSRTRASVILGQLNQPDGVTEEKQKELSKILTAALNSNKNILAIKRYSKTNGLVVEIGGSYNIETPLPTQQKIQLVKDNGTYLVVVLTPVKAQKGATGVIGYDQVFFSLSPLTAVLSKVNVDSDKTYAWLVFQAGQWHGVTDNATNYNLKRMQNIVKKSLLIQNTTGFSKITDKELNYYTQFFSSDKMAFVLELPQSELSGSIIERLYLVPIALIIWLILASFIAAVILRPILKSVFFHSSELENIVEEKTREVQQLNNDLTREVGEKSLITALDNAVRGVDRLDSFAKVLLAFFATHFNIRMSSYYAVNEEAAKITGIIGHGVASKQISQKSYPWGEGQIGQCIADKVIVTIDELPENYLNITTGLGDATPKSVVLLPIIYDHNVLAVIELCSFSNINDETITQIESLLNLVSVNASMITSKENLMKALKDLEEKSYILQQQEEELRSSNEELSTQATVLQQSEEELRTINEQIAAKLKLIEYQKDEIKKKSDEIKKTSHYKSEFLANMSHELRTPLNSLLILAQGFMKNRDGNLTEEQIDEAKIIYEAGNDLLVLINEILDISKVEAGRMVVQMIPVELNEVSTAVSRQFHAAMEDRGLDFVINVDESIRTFSFTSDPNRLLQILKNLLSNAMKFTEEGSVTLEINKEEDSLIFKVTDTGIGISKENQGIIFSEFRQVDGSSNRKFGGTGLGLAISKKLAFLMQGSLILADSIVGKGTTFILRLPLSFEEAPVVSSTAESTSKNVHETEDLPEGVEIEEDVDDDRASFDKDSPSILVIDDDKNFTKVISTVIRDNNYQVLLALSGKAGLQLAANYLPTGIILDLGLPDISGEAVLAKLKKDFRTSVLPVHIISGREEPGDVMSKGAVSFLKKPVEKNCLDSLLQDLVDTEKCQILVVEDDPISQKDIKEVFEGVLEGVSLDFANTASNAVSQLEKKQYACLVVDLGLPDSSGISLIHTLVSKMDIIVPIIVYTARELTPDEYKQVHKYTNKVIIKGLKASERLLDEIRLFLNHLESHKDNKVTGDMVVASRHFDGQRVLLVDDDLRNSFALSRHLEAEGLEVVIADNGKFAIEKLQNDKPFDLILMDMMMPVMDGYETIQYLKSQDRYKNIPVIALTAKATQTDKNKILACGADDCLCKPLEMNALLQLIVLWLSKPVVSEQK